jgi:hypothetical protein
MMRDYETKQNISGVFFYDLCAPCVQ